MFSRRAPRTPATAGRKTPSRTNSREKMVIKDPVEVYCRLRPVSVADEGYIKLTDDRTVQLATPDNSIGNRGVYKEIQYTFSVSIYQINSIIAIYIQTNF
jgi:hypothetical protein